MPLRNTVKKFAPPLDARDVRTGQYQHSPGAGRAPYKPVPSPAARPAASFATSSMPTSSTRDLSYFFNLARSLYGDATRCNDPAGDAPPSFESNIDGVSIDPAAVLVMWLFRQTATHVLPVAERFHLGPADRQPLYSLTAQPSIRTACEFNELAIKRRDPIAGTWFSVCISDVEPALDLTKGSWRVASMVLESVPVWKKIVSGQVVQEETLLGQGNRLRLTWGDKASLGPLGDAYGLWWETGVDGGLAEVFYLVEQWEGFDSRTQGMIRAKAAVKGVDGQYVDPRQSSETYAAVYFYADEKTPPQFVCTSLHAQIKLDILMSGLMTVMVIETRKEAMKRAAIQDTEPPPYRVN